MPYSLEDQLKLLNPRIFEEICDKVIKRHHPFSYRVEGSSGDDGIDIFCGEIDKNKRSSDESKLYVWQVKFFPYGIKPSQRQKIKASIERVINLHNPEFWTLCVPINLTIDEQIWFSNFKLKYENTCINILQADKIIKEICESNTLLNSYFLVNNKSIPEEVINKITMQLEDFTPVSDLVKNVHKEEPIDFYNGKIPSWSNIVFDNDTRREKIGIMWDFVVKSSNTCTGRIPFLLITGQSGDGKSTILKRLAYELVKQGYSTTFFCKSNQFLRYEQFRNPPPETNYYIFIDNIAGYSIDIIKDFFDGLCSESIPAIVIGADIISLIEKLNIKTVLASTTEMVEVNLCNITNNDIDAFLDKWNENSEHSKEYLGSLAFLSYKEQVAVFRKRAKSQLIVALMEIRYRQEFVAYILCEFYKFNKIIQNACMYVCAMHRLDLPLPINTLENLITKEIIIENDIYKNTSGFLILDNLNIITRHSVIADKVFMSKSKEIQIYYYEKIVRNIDYEHIRLITRTINILILKGETDIAEILLKTCMDVFADSSVYYHMYAHYIWHNKNDITNAKKLLQIALQRNPQDATVYNTYAILEKEQGNINKARELFNQALKINTMDGHTYVSLALLEKEQGNYNKAQDLFQKALNINPRNVPVYHAWSAMEKTKGNINKAKNLLNNALRIAPNNAYIFHELALIEKEQGNINDAREIINKALVIVQNSVYLLITLAIIEKEDGNMDEARGLFQKALSIDSKNPTILQTWAIFEKEQGNIDKARELFKNAVRIDPKQIENYHAWALLEKEENNIVEARKLFYKAISINTNNAYAYHALGIMEKEQGNITKARELFKQGTLLNKGDTALFQSWALLEKEQGNISQARVLFSTAVENSNSDVFVYQAWSILEKEQGNVDKAIELLNKAIAIKPKDSSLYHAWAIIENERKNFEKARELFEKIIIFDPKHTYSYQSLAILEKQQGNIERARELFNCAININPKDIPLYQAWALLEKEQGNIEKARELFKRAASIGKKSAFVYQAWALFEKEQGNLEIARELLYKFVTIDTKSAHSYHALALMEKELGNIDKAREFFEISANLDNKANSFQSWGVMESEQNNIECARELFNKAIIIDPKHIYTYHSWGILERNVKNFNKAKDLFNKCIEIDPTNSYSYQSLAAIEREQGNLENARAFYRKALINAPNDMYIYKKFSLFEMDNGNLGSEDIDFSARWLLKKATEIFPNIISFWKMWADMELNQLNFEKAESLYIRTVKLENNSILCSRLCFNIAIKFGKLGDYDKKLKFLLLTVSKNPDDYIAHSIIGKMYSYKNNFTEAEKYFQLSLSLKPNEELTKNNYEKMLARKQKFLYIKECT